MSLLALLLSLPCSAAVVRAPEVTLPPAAPFAVLAAASPAPLSAVSLPALPQLELGVAVLPQALKPGAPAEAAAGLSGQAFDFSRGRPASAVDAGSAGIPPPAYLSVADPNDAAWLGEVVLKAHASRSARRVLGAVEKLAASQGRPVLIRFAQSKLAGEYNYDTELVGLNNKFRKLGPMADVSTLIHELQHVLQKPQGLPSDAFELELEAYLVDFRVAYELGLKAPKGSFDAKAQGEFRKSLKGFIAWLQNEYRDNIPLIGSNIKAYRETVEGQKARSLRLIKKWTKELAAREAVLAQMRATGQKPESIAAYESEVAGAKRNLTGHESRLAWAERDLALLNDPVSRKRYRKFAHKVLDRAREYQRQYASFPP